MSSICRTLTPWRWLVEAETYVGAFELLVRIQCICWFLNFCCDTWGSHCAAVEDLCILVYDAVSIGNHSPNENNVTSHKTLVRNNRSFQLCCDTWYLYVYLVVEWQLWRNSERSSDREIICNYHCKMTVTLALTLTFEAVNIDSSKEPADTACSAMIMHSVSASHFSVITQPRQTFIGGLRLVFILFMKPVALLYDEAQR